MTENLKLIPVGDRLYVVVDEPVEKIGEFFVPQTQRKKSYGDCFSGW
jgi:hypothetical protein